MRFCWVKFIRNQVKYFVKYCSCPIIHKISNRLKHTRVLENCEMGVGVVRPLVRPNILKTQYSVDLVQY